KYVGLDIDPRKIGKELRVGRLLTGSFRKQGDKLVVTLEAIDVPTDRLVWESSVTAKPEDMINLQQQLSAQIEHGLLPVLGGGGAVETASRPKNQEAYDLYLRSVAQPHDPKPNKEAIKMLEWGDLGRAYDAASDLVRRRPQSADAHFALSYVLRYAGMLAESTQECNTARQLDPGNFLFRSCAWSFLEMGKMDRAMDFVQLD